MIGRARSGIVTLALVFVLVAATSVVIQVGGASTAAATTSQYSVVSASRTRLATAEHAGEASAREAEISSPRGYDDFSNPARTFARSGGEGLAPNTAARFGDDVLALPRGGANLSQQRLDHIVARHWPTSGTTNAGHFAPGTTGRGLTSMIDDAVRGGGFRPNTAGRPGTIFEYNFGSTIGSNAGGNATSWPRVVVDPNGNVITAFPF